MPEEDPIHALVAQVFDVAPASVSDASSPDTLRGWDSIGHLRLVTALEERLGVELDPDDILELETVADVRRIFERHRAASGASS